jgi:hypothetical protein
VERRRREGLILQLALAILLPMVVGLMALLR